MLCLPYLSAYQFYCSVSLFYRVLRQNLLLGSYTEPFPYNYFMQG
jgi:hypothetical protein